MQIWNSYPETYRSAEITALLNAIRAGESAWVVGLSGSGKSNLAGFFANRIQTGPQKILIDCNRLTDPTPAGLYRLARRCLGSTGSVSDELEGLDESLNQKLQQCPAGLCLVFDRFETISSALMGMIGANLRSLRDAYKYQLTYVVTSRLEPDPQSEMAELFFGHILWLGPLVPADAAWSAGQYASRNQIQWDPHQIQVLLEASGGYASLLRAACEAAAAGCEWQVSALQSHPAMRRRLDEFWAFKPSSEAMHLSALDQISVFERSEEKTEEIFDLTANEARLLAYLQAHPEQVCEKDDLVKAVWPEDRVYVTGIRDDSLAQLVRRLRLKVEEDPSNPQHIQTIAGRGYRYKA